MLIHCQSFVLCIVLALYWKKEVMFLWKTPQMEFSFLKREMWVCGQILLCDCDVNSLTTVLLFLSQGSYSISPVEVKSQVLSDKSHSAQEQLKEFLGVEDYNPQRKYLICLSAQDPALQKLIGDEKDTRRHKGESCQLAHHVHTYGSTDCWLLVGNHHHLLYAVHVTFPNTFVSSYKILLDVLYENCFEFLYCHTLSEDMFPTKAVKKALNKYNEGKKKGNQVNWHKFMTNYCLWQFLNIEPDTRAIRFPLPPSKMFIPTQIADWNLSKGPLDILTKLFDECEESISIWTPQTVAIARMLSVSSTAFHKCLQINNSKDYFRKYKTHDNFWKVANN